MTQKSWTLVVLAMGLSNHLHAALLGTYSFATDTSVPSAPGMTFGSFQRQNLTAASAPGQFSSSGWKVGTPVDPGEYVQFVLTPTAGNILSLTDFAFTYTSTKSKGNGNDGGPANLSIAVYAGNWGTGSSPGTVPVSQTFSLVNDGKSKNLTWDFADQLSTTGFTVRLYGWNAENGAGTLAFDNFAVNGTLTPIPEPTQVALGVFGVLFAGGAVGRWMIRRSPVA